MRLIKTLLLLLVAASVFAQPTTNYVQPMGYSNYSFPYQVNIGNGSVKKTGVTAYLEIGPSTGANKGLLLPRLSTTERDAISSPATGLMIYNKTTNRANFFTGSAWEEMDANTWSRFGNSGTSPLINFVGTTDSTDLRFRVNNIRVGRISPLNPSTALDSLHLGSIALGNYALANDTFVNGNIAIGSYALRNTNSQWSASNIAIGHMAMHNSTTGSNNVAMGFRALARATDAFRVVAIGTNAGHNMTVAEKNTFVGAMAGEWTTTGSYNDFFGQGSGRNNTFGTVNTFIGTQAGYYNTGSILSASVSGSSTGDWTTATITFSAPDVTPYGFTPSVQATGTVQLGGGSITGITITEPGVGYSQGATGTITGDGATPGTVTVVMGAGSFNVALGADAGFHNRFGYGNTYLGYRAGYSSSSFMRDSNMVFIGNGATRGGGGNLKNSMAIGASAIVSQSNTISFPTETRIGIGTATPFALFQIANPGATTNTTMAINSTIASALIPVVDVSLTSATTTERTGFSFLSSSALPGTRINGLFGGRSTSANNMFAIGFQFEGAGSANNYGALSISGHADILTWHPDNSVNLRGWLHMRDTTVPATPPSDMGTVYIRADSLRFMNDAGDEHTVGRSSGGGGGSGTVTSVGSGYGLYGGAITTTGTLAVDTTEITTRDWLYKVIDSLPTGGGSGDVVGPASATDNSFALFDGVTGKLVKSAATAIHNGTWPIWTNTATNSAGAQFIINGNSGVQYLYSGNTNYGGLVGLTTSINDFEIRSLLLPLLLQSATYTRFASNGSTVKGRLSSAGNWYMGGDADGTARLHIAAGSTSEVPVKIDEGSLATTPEDGAIEHSSDNLYFSTGGTPNRYTLLKAITSSQSIDFSSIAAGGNNQNDIIVTGAAIGDMVVVSQDSAEGNVTYSAWVSNTDTVRVKAHNTSGSPIDPASATFKVVVIKY